MLNFTNKHSSVKASLLLLTMAIMTVSAKSIKTFDHTTIPKHSKGNNVILGFNSTNNDNLIDLLYQVNPSIDPTALGCKCIMSAPDANGDDNTLCMCINRKDGTLNDSDQCGQYQDTVAWFCGNTTTDYQDCLGYYCSPVYKPGDSLPQNITAFPMTATTS